MTISDLKDLEKLITLCRKKGIDSIKVDNIELKLGAVEPTKRYKSTSDVASDPDYSPDDILNWSSAPIEGMS